MIVKQMARVVYAANRELELYLGDPEPSPPWEEAADWQRKATTKRVIEALAGQTALEQHDGLSEAQATKDQLLLAIVGALRGRFEGQQS